MHDRLKKARISAGYSTATDAIRRFGWKGSTYRAHENSQNQYDAETAKIYGQAYGVSPGWLLTGEGDMSPRTAAAYLAEPREGARNACFVPLKGKVAAGIWSEVFLAEKDDTQQRRTPLPTDPRFPEEIQFDLVIEGASLNRFAQEGDYIRCIDARDADAEIQDGDLVVIERMREKTLREISGRRLQRNGDRHEFWPESDDPRWQAPLVAKNGVSESGEEIRVIGKILWKYREP